MTPPSTLSKTGSSSLVHVLMHVNGSEELKLAGPNIQYLNAMYVEYILCINFPKNPFCRTCCGKRFQSFSIDSLYIPPQLSFSRDLEASAGSFKPLLSVVLSFTFTLKYRESHWCEL